MKLILACDPNGGIGYKNKLPWDKIQGDLPRFKQLTENGIVVMGRNTWESLPKKPLSNRVNVVISNTLKTEDAIVLPNLGRLKNAQGAWIIGGAKLIESAWEHVNEIHLTFVLAEYTCDTFIDLVKLKKDFIQVTGSGHGDHSYEVWKRR
jgi:dihydrofolate reductase